MSALFGAKNARFFEIYGRFARTRVEGVEPVLTVFGKGEGSIFCDFVRTSFMDDPYINLHDKLTNK